MKPEELEAIKKRLEAATPGKWLHMFTRAFQETPKSPDKKVCTIFATGPILHEDEAADFIGPDMEFIANAKEDISSLLAYVETLEGQLRVAVEALKFYGDQDHNWFSAGLEGDSESYDGIMGDRARKSLEKNR